MNSALEQSYDGQIKMIRDILGVNFEGEAFEEKEQFVAKHRKELDKIIARELDATYEVFTNQVKVFCLNDCDWVAAKSMEEAIAWYRQNIEDSEDAIYDEREVEDLTTFMITLEKMSEDNVDFKHLGHLQNKYLDQEADSTFKVPAADLLAIEWRGKPFIFASKEY